MHYQQHGLFLHEYVLRPSATPSYDSAYKQQMTFDSSYSKAKPRRAKKLKVKNKNY